MSGSRVVLELTPNGMDIIRHLRRSDYETPEEVIMRALSLLRAVRKYMEDDSLTVMNPNTAGDNDLVRLNFQASRH